MRKQQILVEDMLSVYVLRRIGTKGRPDIQVVQRILIATRQSERLGTGQKHLLAAKQRNLRIRKPCLSLHVIHLEVLVELGDNERIVARIAESGLIQVDSRRRAVQHLDHRLPVDAVTRVSRTRGSAHDNGHAFGNQQIARRAGSRESHPHAVGRARSGNRIPVVHIVQAIHVGRIVLGYVKHGSPVVILDRLSVLGHFVQLRGRRQSERIGIGDHRPVVARIKRHTGPERVGRIQGKVIFGLSVVGAPADIPDGLIEIVLDFLQRAGHRAPVVILDHDVLGLGHVWNARIHIGVHVRELRVEHVGIHRQQREMIVCPGHQGFGALLACVRLLGGRKRLDSRQRMVGRRNGLVNGRPVLLVGVVARFRTGVLVPHETADDEIERRRRLRAVERCAHIDDIVATRIE